MYRNISNVKQGLRNLPDSIQLPVKFNIEKLQYCIDHFDDIYPILGFDLLQIKLVQEALSKVKATHGKSVSYRAGTRWIPMEASFINIKKEIRIYCCNDCAIDIDGVSSHASIFTWFATTVGLDTFKFKGLAGILEKHEYYSILNGGDSLGFDDAVEEVNLVLPEILKFWPELDSKDLRPYNRSGQIMSRFLNMIEKVIVYHAIQEFQQAGYEVNSIYYDGFHITRDGKPVFEITDVLLKISDDLMNLYGIRYAFKVKEHHDIILESCTKVVHKTIPIVRDEPYVHINVLEHPSRVILIDAKMSLGKSTCILNYITKHKLEYDSIVIVCPRITYSKTVLAQMKEVIPSILHYGATQSKKIANPNIIIQFESLVRLDPSKFTGRKILLIMDECEATFTQFTSFETNTKNHEQNIRRLKLLMDVSTKIFMSDAFVSFSQKTLRTLTYLSATDPLFDYTYFQYSRNPTHRPYMEAPALADFTSCLHASLRTGKTVFLFSTSAHQAAIFKTDIQGWFPGLPIAIYTQKEKTTHLQNVTEEWSRYKVVICSSVITIGIDFNIEHFDHLYLYATQKSNNLVRDIMQASLRPRKIKEATIICINENANGSKSMKYRVDLNYQKDKVLSVQQKYSKYILENGLSELPPQTSPWILNLFIYNAHEHIQDVYHLRDRLLAAMKVVGYVRADSNDPNFVFAKSILAEDEDDPLYYEEILEDPNPNPNPNPEVEVKVEVDVESNPNPNPEVEVEVDVEVDVEVEVEVDEKATSPFTVITYDKKRYRYSYIPEMKKEELAFKSLVTTPLDTLKRLKYKYMKVCTLDATEGSGFQFYIDHTSTFYRLLREKKYYTNPSKVNFTIMKTVSTVPNPEWIRTITVANILKEIGLTTSYSEYGKQVNVTPFYDRYSGKKQYMTLCELLEIQPNKNRKLTTISTGVTVLNHILDKYTAGVIYTSTVQKRIDKKRIRINTYTYEQDLIKPYLNIEDIDV